MTGALVGAAAEDVDWDVGCDVGWGVGEGAAQLASVTPAVRNNEITAAKSEPLRNRPGSFGFTFAFTFRLRLPTSMNLR
jgi:hypothetical protein